MLSKKKKVYLKLNLVSILFAIVSLVSVTLAWFAYSGLASARIEKNNQAVSNNIVISLDDIYPGMDPKIEVINIKNLGDTDAKLKYKINSARILNSNADYYTVNNNTTSEYIEDAIAHNYPFHINIAFDKLYIDAKEQATFKVSVTWPLDSGNNSLDSQWGRNAYLYEEAQKQLESAQRAPAIEVMIDVTAEQAIDDLDSVDINYLLGKRIYYDPTNDVLCNSPSATCLETHVIDTFNKVQDQTVSLLPTTDLGDGTYDEYQSINPSWVTNYRLLTSEDVIKILSLDIENSKIKINGISDRVVGRILNNTRSSSIINNIVSNNGYVEYSSFTYLQSVKCIWTNSSYGNLGFALDRTKLYGENKNTECRMIPVLTVPKNKLAVE